MNKKPKIEVCFSPKLYGHKLTTGKFNTVVVDILRATTSICAAFEHGVKEIIPVSGLDEAEALKRQGYFVACERNGSVIDFADIGNSASDFIRDDLKGETVVFSTTNGTKTINQARDAEEVLVGSFANMQSLAEYLTASGEDTVIFCAAWKNLFNLEDSIFAGALAEILLKNGFQTVCDSTLAALDLWHLAQKDVKAYLAKCSHRNRLKHLVSDKDFEYTVKQNSTSVVPKLRGDRLVVA
ncbi:MAG: 2-phosphosulfolactate phosphatase [Cyclobacteriaceae bacterium]|nr:2-phosphosulfolactate phosphatase [Cyclobacteriaceae bacterium]